MIAVPPSIADDVQRTYASLPVRVGDVVLDLGAHVGAAATLFLDQGAAHVVAVEPDPANLEALQHNLAGRAATIIAAAVGPATGETVLFAFPGRSFLSTTIADDPGRGPVQVPVIAFDELLERYRPSVVKCDIEFGEYDLSWKLPAFVRVVALELHIRYDLIFLDRRETPVELRRRRRHAASLIQAMADQGFVLLYSLPKLGPGPGVSDTTGLDPLARSIDAAWVRA